MICCEIVPKLHGMFGHCFCMFRHLFQSGIMYCHSSQALHHGDGKYMGSTCEQTSSTQRLSAVKNKPKPGTPERSKLCNFWFVV